MHPPPVLLVGQDADRVRGTSEAFAAGGLLNPVVECADGDEATAYLLGQGPYADRQTHPLPAVVVSDLRLERGSGLEVLRTVRRHLNTRRTPVIVVAAEATDEEIAEVHRLGAAAHLSQAVAVHSLLDIIRDLGMPWSISRVEASG